MKSETVISVDQKSKYKDIPDTHIRSVEMINIDPGSASSALPGLPLLLNGTIDWGWLSFNSLMKSGASCKSLPFARAR